MSSACSIDSDPEPEQTEHIRFGSFSLGDVINSEIKKFGRFALRGRNSSGQAASKFIKEFSKSVSPQKVPDGNYRAGTPSRKTENTRGVLANNPAKAQTDPVKPSYPLAPVWRIFFPIPGQIGLAPGFGFQRAWFWWRRRRG
jgi:hypothetical protein